MRLDYYPACVAMEPININMVLDLWNPELNYLNYRVMASAVGPIIHIAPHVDMGAGHMLEEAKAEQLRLRMMKKGELWMSK